MLVHTIDHGEDIENLCFMYNVNFKHESTKTCVSM